MSRYATPVSSTATTAPRPPGALRALASDHASGMLMPNGPVKFHCRLSPGSFLVEGACPRHVVGDRVPDMRIAAQPGDGGSDGPGAAGGGGGAPGGPQPGRAPS